MKNIYRKKSLVIITTLKKVYFELLKFTLVYYGILK